jgi:hypothetical protein
MVCRPTIGASAAGEPSYTRHSSTRPTETKPTSAQGLIESLRGHVPRRLLADAARWDQMPTHASLHNPTPNARPCIACWISGQSRHQARLQVQDEEPAFARRGSAVLQREDHAEGVLTLPWILAMETLRDDLDELGPGQSQL